MWDVFELRDPLTALFLCVWVVVFFRTLNPDHSFLWAENTRYNDNYYDERNSLLAFSFMGMSCRLFSLPKTLIIFPMGGKH